MSRDQFLSRRAVSPSLEEREARWRAWFDLHRIINLPEVEFKLMAHLHWCGAATPITEEGEQGCSGCHTEITDPLMQCAPLYGIDA